MTGKFIGDVRALFGRRQVSYVEVGAYRGEGFRDVLASGVQVLEAHLIEPNPAAFGELAAVVDEASQERARCYNFALGATSGKLKLRNAGAATRVAEGSAIADGLFEAKCHTLDELAKTFIGKRISILKISVEGYEAQVLRGAERLLKEQAIDIVYLDVGLNRSNSDPSYYRTLEDLLNGWRYRIFRFYEQENEALDDSPFLQRASIAFLSEAFAAQTPYRLTRELSALQESHGRIEGELAETRAALAGLTTSGEARDREAEARTREFAQLHLDHQAASDRNAELASRLAAADERTREMEERIARLEREAAEREARHAGELEVSRNSLESETSKFRDQLADARKRIEEQRTRAAEAANRVKGQLSYRLGAELVQGTKSFSKFVRLPAALIRASRDFDEQRKSSPSSPRPKSENGAAAKDPLTTHVSMLHRKMWAGYADQAVAELMDIANNPQSSARGRSHALHAVARWEFTFGSPERALDLVSQSIAIGGAVTKQKTKQQLVLKTLCELRTGAGKAARETSNTIEKELGRDIDVLLLRAAASRQEAISAGTPSGTVDDLYLADFNKAFQSGKLAPVRKLNPDQPLSLANLTADAAPDGLPQIGKVSVVLPAYNAAATIDIALKSLMAQTWRNIEVVVVDDCSTDDTCEVVSRFSAADPRVRLIRREVNGGAYPARNDGAAAATGDYIMVHDCDDWSHPQKIEMQMRQLTSQPQAVAVMSDWLRVGDNLEVVGTWRPKSSLLDQNFSSLMFRRSILSQLGGWDEVRVSGDAEFRYRLQAVFGDLAIHNMPRSLMLSLALAREDSLTRTKATHLKSLDYGLRWQYRDAYTKWHADLAKGIGSPRISRGVRSFPAPLAIKPEGVQERPFDIVFMSDFASRDETFFSTLSYIEAARKSDLSVALIHLRDYTQDPTTFVCPEVYDACAKHGIEFLTAGDLVRSNYLVVCNPAILQQVPDTVVAVDCRELLLLIGRPAGSEGDHASYDPVVVKRNAQSLFGREGLWIPLSDVVKRAIENDRRYTNAHPGFWAPILDAGRARQAAIRWRGAERPYPVIGHHSGDAYTRWPSGRASLATAFGANNGWDVRFLGGADTAIRILDGLPKNWRVYDFKDMSVDDFLRDLDFFVHFPDELSADAAWLAPLEAMMLGKPVILPPQFRDRFGAAAIYADASEVPAQVRRLWESEPDYVRQANDARKFAIDRFGQDLLSRRLNRLNLTHLN